MINTEEIVKKFLDKVCVEFGICIPPQSYKEICNINTLNVDELIRKIFAAEGLDIELNYKLYKQVKNIFINLSNEIEIEKTRERYLNSL